MSLHIGIDLGTSGCRAIAVNSERKIIAQLQQPLPPSTRDGTHAEQNPHDWWRTTQQLLAQLFSQLTLQPDEVIETITVDGTSSTLLLTTPQGEPLTPALMYNDQRATIEAKQIREMAPAESGAHGPSSSLAKLLWLLHHHPELSSQPLLALHQADWISNRLCGHYGQSDENNCLKLGYDPIQRSWPNWIHQLPINKGLLPAVAPPGTSYGTLSPQRANALGIEQSAPIRICTGSTDSVAAAVAAGIEQVGDAVTSLGSTLVLKLLSPSPLFAPQFGIYSHRIGDRWLVSGASNAGGTVLLEHFTLDEIASLSEKIDPYTPTGLHYYPLSTTGERFPIADPTYPPQLSPRPEQDHLFLQGILEGISRIEQIGYQKMVELGAPPLRRIFTAGGGSHNNQWSEIRRQLLRAPITTARHPDAAYGAALLPALISNFSSVATNKRETS